MHSMYGKVIYVTPELAAEWMKKNTKNRRMHSRWADKYARDILAGNWPLTHQGIAFDVEGVLLDGQHRLMAVITSGRSVWMFVVFDVPLAARPVIDDGAKRSIADAAFFEDLDLDIERAAVVRSMRLGPRASSLGVMTKPEVFAFYKRHYRAINFGVQVMSGGGSKTLTSAVLRSLVALASYHEKLDRLEQFGTVMRTGLIDAPGDESAIALRNWLLTSKRRPGSNHQQVYRKAQRALQAFCLGDVLTKVYESSDDLYPLPEEES